MAYPVEFEGCNRVYHAPPDRNDIGNLAVFANGVCIVSAWEFTDDEIEEIVRTKRIFLSTMSGEIFFPQFVGSESVVRSVICDYGKIW